MTTPDPAPGPDPVRCVLLITGSRSIDDRVLVFAKLDSLDITPTQLIHGGAKGVDTLAGAWAAKRAIPVKIYRPDFKTYPIAPVRNRGAPFKYSKNPSWKAYGVRDKQMVDAADHVVAIWDGKSSGTQLTMEYAAEQGKLSRTFMCNNDPGAD